MTDIVNGEFSDRVEVKNSEEQYQLILPCDVKDFSQFVSGLLGKPQEEKGKVIGDFQVEPKNISNIFHLINQRVVHQNDGSLMNFTIEVLYDNGTSITHKDVTTFESFYPTSDATPKEIVISFTYLIKFKNKIAPEKQDIEVVISTEQNRLRGTGAWISGGVFEYRINHTDRTWSADIANVLKNHADNFVNKTTWFMKFIARNDDDIFEYVFWAVIFCFCTYWYGSINSLYFNENTSLFENKVFLQHMVNFVYVLISLVVFTKIIEKIAAFRFFVRKLSFITLVDKDYEKMNKKKSGIFWRMLGYFLSLLLNIGAGIVASYVYTNLNA